MIENKVSILLTGASGFVGKEILKFLSHESNTIIKTCGRNNSCDYIIDFTTDKIKLDNHFDLVVHAAGKAHSIPKTSQQEKDFFDVNVSGTKKLLIALEESGKLPQSFLFISSVSVYGLEKGENIGESTPLLAKDAYGRSKIEAEKLVISFCEKHKIICTIFRLPLVVGLNPPGNLASMIKGIRKGYYFNINGGVAPKSMVQASDVSKFIIKATQVGGIFNLTDGHHPTFYELGNHIASQIGKSTVPNIPFFFAKLLAKIGDFIGDSFPINSNKLAKITSPLTFNDSKARVAFGWNPSPVLEEFKLNEND